MLPHFFGGPAARWGAAALLLSLPVLAQLPTSRKTGKSGVEVLKEVDKRLYRATDHGLKSLSFCFRPTISLAKTTPFRVRYTWRDGPRERHERLEFLDAEGKASSTPPPPFEKQGRFFWSSAKSFAHIFRGQRLVDRFKHCSAEVVTRRVNLRDETQVILEPRAPKNLRRLRISLTREGLPWKWERTLLNGHERLEQHNYEKREKGRVLTSMKVMMGATKAGQRGISYSQEIRWQKVNSILVPASITKKTASPDGPIETKVVFTDVRVNTGSK